MLTMGIDAGFENTKAVIMRDGNMLAHAVVANGRRSPAYAACGRNTAMIEYDLLMTLAGTYD